MLKTNEEYAKKAGAHCPHCDSSDLESGRLEADGASAWATVTCIGCGASWTDVYALTGYCNLDAPHEDKKEAAVDPVVGDVKLYSPQLDNSGPDYADIFTTITAGDKDWRFQMMLDKSSGKISEADLDVAESPNGEFNPSKDEPPGDVIQAYNKLRPAIVAMLDECRPNLAVSVQHGVATVETGVTVDLLAIQKVLNDAFCAEGDQKYADAANEMAKLTGKIQGPHGDWIDAGT